MHLKSLTLKGFKSFASSTTLRFEPGITCVVGPNGSGKSNVVDALSWVMGVQAAKALRGGKMEDVIFAGTAGRPALGRAEVSLTIDNSDGALPIEYSEVSITRRMFRDGAGEYEINGAACRLLDVQELLSDSGIGREMHVIVGQGQLASILEAKPEERRAFVEEAAGVLKHRKRKEKALRKLDAMQANLTRLGDLTTELRRQLKPLGRQAEIARKAQAVQADLRDARLRLLADDLVSQRDALARDEADEAAARAKQAQVDAALTAARTEQTRLEEALAETAPRMSSAQDTWYSLSALAERLRGTVRLAAERARHLAAPSEGQRRGRDPEELEDEAQAAAEQEAELAESVEMAREALAEAAERRADLEAEAVAAERAHLAAVRAIADRREGLATLAGRVDTLRSRAGAAAEEIDRLGVTLAESRERSRQAAEEFETLQREWSTLGDDERELDARHESARTAYEAATARVAELTAQHRDAEQRIAAQTARAEVLTMSLERRDGTGALLAAVDTLPSVRGPVSEALTVEPGFEAAVAAVLGTAADAVVVADLAGAGAALDLLHAQDAGRAGMLVGGAPVPTGTRGPAPDGGRWALDVVRTPDALRGAVHRLLDGVVLVADRSAAQRVVTADPALRAVSADGDVLGAGWVHGGSGRSGSPLEIQAALDEAIAARTAAEHDRGRLAAELAAAGTEDAERADDAANALAALHESDARHEALGEQLARLGQTARVAEREAARSVDRRTEVEQRRDQALVDLAEHEERLRLVRDEPMEHEPDSADRDAAGERLGAARSAEVDGRLALRTAEERARAVQGRADQLRRAARAEREARERAAAAAEARQRGAAVARAAAEAGQEGLTRIEVSLRRAVADRDAVAAERAHHEHALTGVRATARDLAVDLAKLTDSVHRDEVLRAEARLRVETLESRIVDDFGIGLDDLVGEYGPDVVVPPPATEVAEYEAARDRGDQVSAPAPSPYDRAEQQRRMKRAERDLALLGKVNPLALEEFAALEERYRFLSTQLEDLKATRRDLLTVVAEVDDKILEVFTTAYHDVAREFELVFETLFPGGEGRLVLTDPDDMLTTGIDVEARPPGKRIKRLSLLSGGEKSLTAVAMLVAIFRARPSPFYVMDEVEAALDDTNLRRLISLFELLRERSQLIVITHQKPTMEVADALYGVSMRGDGITTVISQRLRAARDTVPVAEQPEPTPAG